MTHSLEMVEFSQMIEFSELIGFSQMIWFKLNTDFYLFPTISHSLSIIRSPKSCFSYLWFVRSCLTDISVMSEGIVLLESYFKNIKTYKQKLEKRRYGKNILFFFNFDQFRITLLTNENEVFLYSSVHKTLPKSS